MDLAANKKDVEGVQYKGTDAYGRSVTFTLPCGAPIPPGAVCICNCVPGSSGTSSRSYDSVGVCTCDLVCTCNTVCTCLSVQTYSYHYWYPN